MDPDCFPMVAMSCDHCGIVAQVPVRKVTVRVTAYANESFVTTRCNDCHSIVARKLSLMAGQHLLANGAQFAVFKDYPAITEADVDAFVTALHNADVVELAKETGK
jgi:hypothetical protein